MSFLPLGVIIPAPPSQPLTRPRPSFTRARRYYWNPTREDRIGVCMGIFQEDGVSKFDVEELVDTFPGQSIDFFGALRARVYDDKVRTRALLCVYLFKLSVHMNMHPLQCIAFELLGGRDERYHLES